MKILVKPQWTMKSVLFAVAAFALFANWCRDRVEYHRDETRFDEILDMGIQIPETSHIKEFEKLIAKHPEFSTHFRALHFSARNCSLEINRSMILQGADVNQIFGWCAETPLTEALLHGDREVAVYFLDSGANPDLAGAPIGNGDASLVAALCHQNRLNDVELLFSYGASLANNDDNDQYPLRMAVWYGDLEVIEFLLKNGAVTDDGLEDIKKLRVDVATVAVDASQPKHVRDTYTQVNALLNDALERFDSRNK